VYNKVKEGIAIHNKIIPGIVVHATSNSVLCTVLEGNDVLFLFNLLPEVFIVKNLKLL